jgi:hypothetical protein
VLGLAQDVIQFDKARVRHKQHLKNATYSKDHDKMLAIIHTRVSKQRQLLKEEINSWEKEFYSTNGQLPTKQDLTDNLAMKQAIKQLQCADPSPPKNL